MNKMIDSGRLDQLLGKLFGRRLVPPPPRDLFVMGLKKELGSAYDKVYPKKGWVESRNWNFIFLARKPFWAPVFLTVAVLVGVFFWGGGRQRKEVSNLASMLIDLDLQLDVLDRENQELTWMADEMMDREIDALGKIQL